MLPNISVVIPTRNRSDDLSRLLEALTRQTVEPGLAEVIVVDNGSSDGTLDLVESFLCRLPALVAVSEEAPGLHAARNRGVAVASAPIVLFGDDDIVPEPEWIETVESAFRRSDVGLVTGPVRPLFDRPPPEWYPELVVTTGAGWYVPEYSILDLGEVGHSIAPEFVFGCNFGVRRELVNRLGGFHPDALPNDLLRFRGDGETSVARRVVDLGFQALYVPEAGVGHRVSGERLSLDYVEKRSFMEGVSASYVDIRSSGTTPSRQLHVARTRAYLRRALARLERSEVTRRKRRGFFDGYLWHQAQVTASRDLRTWVMQENYLGPIGDVRFRGKGATPTTDPPAEIDP